MKTATRTLPRRGARTRTWLAAGAALVALAMPGRAPGAGTLTPVGAAEQPIRILAHHVDVVINNGFARTEVTQTFQNPNAVDLEGIYSFPVPKSASLSEMTIWTGENELQGEVLPKAEADRVYEEEKQAGNNAGKAQKNDYQTFEFRVSPIRAGEETRVRFVYYQPLVLDTGVGRYLYPLESGGTDDQADSFWTQNQKVEGAFSVKLTLRSVWPIADARVPGCEAVAQVTRPDENHAEVILQTTEGALDRDFLFYYRLADNLPGRVEMVPYRPDPAKPGTFMLVLTPGIDLQPLTGGADYVYVLDKSGSMTGGKIAKLAQGVQKAIGAMRPEDRFRVIAFDSGAREITAGWTPAGPEKMRAVCEQVAALRADGSTDIHSGLKLALNSLDQDRATSIVLVTDGVANTGVVDPAAFEKLLRTYDVRVFGFVMGNSANWPLMDLIGRATGGFSCGVSNDDDIVGQIMLAKSKILHECLHDAEVRIEGVRTYDLTDGQIGKVYRGQQLVLFGRYEGSGRARVTLKAGLTGEDRTYTTEFDFPVADTDNPEIERLWALNQIEQAKRRAALGLLPDKERQDLERSLGVDYQLVTDETSMVVLSDDVFARRGIERRNQTRVAEERRAQSLRSARPVQSYRVDTSAPAFPSRAPSLGGGAGAIDPLGAAAAVAALLAAGRVLKGRARAS